MKKTWYKEGVVYQIYPRSFKDSNGDGIGDLNGIREKIDYLHQLGVTMVWLSPVYESPNDDNGYDISNYENIMKDFGTLEDWQKLISELHAKGIKLIMDLVINHTSDEHPWFIESRKNRTNPYRNYYIWRDGKKGKVPNNWSSFFTGNAWEWDETSNQYYLHLFSKKQPDLNWDYPPVREAIKKMIRFWLDRGVDGFRCDVINLISKKEGLPSGKLRIALTGKEHYVNGPHVHEYLKEINRDVLSHYDSMTVGEVPFTTAEEAIQFIADDRQELSMMFHFEHMNVDSINNKWLIVPWTVKKLKKVLTRWQEVLQKHGGWNALYFENHDQPRSLSRFGNPTKYPYESATLLAMLLLTQQGTPFLYQGQEIGMTNFPFKDTQSFYDVESKRIYELGRHGLHLSEKFMFRTLSYMSRDNARTPMQWDRSTSAGFTTGTPWMPVNPNYLEVNVEASRQNPHSIYQFYRQLIALRRQESALIYGRYELYERHHPRLYVFSRQDDAHHFLIILNFSAQTTSFKWPKKIPFTGEIKLANYADSTLKKAGLLRPYESLLIQIS